MTPQPAVAKSYDVSDDKRTYNVPLREECGLVSDGNAITSRFVLVGTRMLQPGDGVRYNFQLFSVPYRRGLVPRGRSR